jgi:hypothetical protein
MGKNIQLRKMNTKVLRLYIVLFVLLIEFPAFSQSNELLFCCDSSITQINEPKLVGELFLISRVGEGSQFFKDAWLLGDIYLNDQRIVKNKWLKYNGFQDELIWFENKNRNQIKLDKDLIKGFSLKDLKELNGQTFNFSKIKIKKDFSVDSTIIFGQELFTGKISLFSYRRVILDIPKQISNDNRNYYIDVYKPSHLYFFRLFSGKTIGFKTIRKKVIMAIFPEKAESIKIALTEKKLRRFKTEAELIQLTEILNSILY